MIHLLLFDVDSVLVESVGYLRALQDTVAYFSRQMGVGEHLPTEDEVRVFEANGLSNEWDSGAVCVAVLLLGRLRVGPPLDLPADWAGALAALAAHPLALPRPDFAAVARRVGQQLGGRPGAIQVAHAVLRHEAEATLGREHNGSTALVLLDALLGQTYDFHRAPVTRYFQHLVIGSRAVAKTYGVTPDLASASYLGLYDRPLLTPDTRTRLERTVAHGRVKLALYTARPSLPPVELNGRLRGYSPEAEAARSLVALEGYPLIAMGRMRWLAREVGVEVNQLVKPSPVQGLAAIGAAASGQEKAALEAAMTLWREGRLLPPLAGLGPVTVHVFEDSERGVTAVEGAVNALRAAGLAAGCRAYGIVGSHGPKAAAMAARGTPTYPSVNEAILAAWQEILGEVQGGAACRYGERFSAFMARPA